MPSELECADCRQVIAEIRSRLSLQEKTLEMQAKTLERLCNSIDQQVAALIKVVGAKEDKEVKAREVDTKGIDALSKIALILLVIVFLSIFGFDGLDKVKMLFRWG